MNGLMLIASWKELFEANGALKDTVFSGWVPGLMNILTMVMWVVLGLVGAAGGIYAVYVGIKMARADSAEQREENKKRLINILLSLVAVAVLILIFNIFLPMIIGAVWAADYSQFDPGWGKDPSVQNPNGQQGGVGQQSLLTIVNTVRCLIGR